VSGPCENNVHFQLKRFPFFAFNLYFKGRLIL
jgi:hypothetical protein